MPRVLVADDKDINLEVERRMLERIGCEVATALTGVEAVEKAAAGAFDLIILDITMPIMDGCQAARAISAAPGYAGAKIIALTGADPDEVCGAEELFAEIVQKPVTMDMFRSMIKKHC